MPTEQMRDRILAIVDAGNLSWRRRGSQEDSFRVWLTDDEYRPLTTSERRAVWALIYDGVIRREQAGGYGGWAPRGPVSRGRDWSAR